MNKVSSLLASRRSWPLMLGLTVALGACAQPPATPISAAADHDGHTHSVEVGQAGPDRAELPTGARLAPDRLTVPRGPLTVQTLPSNAQVGSVALKVLILSSGPGDFGIASARAILQQSGVPYDVLDATTTPLTTSSLIGADGVGRYQGVILTDSALTFQSSPGVYSSALDSSEWATLFEYQKAYKVRQLALYGAPTTVPEDYGLRLVSGAEFATGKAIPTAAGKNALKDLTGNALPITFAYTYPTRVQAVSGITTTPILTDESGLVIGAVSTSAAGRERLILTTAQNPNLLHTQVLGYGLVKWLTRGVHLGEHRRFLHIDIDDWFLAGDHADADVGGTLRPTSFRLSASDALATRTQQSAIRTNYAVARNFRYAVMFNGGGANLSSISTCTPGPSTGVTDALTSVSRCMANDFDWVNHTRDHLRMDVMDAATANTAIGSNRTIGLQLGLSMSRRSLVTGEHSGLGHMDPTDDGSLNDSDVNLPKVDLGLGRSNPNMLSAAVNNGIRYIGSNRSVASHWDASCPSCGIVHPLNPGVFLIPRWPNNIHYHVTTPTEAMTSYNHLYAPGGVAPYWDRALSYGEFLDVESTQGVGHLLEGTAWPTYMHQTNLREYSPGKSLATDWVRAVLDKYSAFSTLPLNTLRWDDLGAYVERRTSEEKAKAAGAYSAVWNRTLNTVTLRRSGSSLPATLTGSLFGTLYGSYPVQQVNVGGWISSTVVIVQPR